MWLWYLSYSPHNPTITSLYMYISVSLSMSIINYNFSKCWYFRWVKHLGFAWRCCHHNERISDIPSSPFLGQVYGSDLGESIIRFWRWFSQNAGLLFSWMSYDMEEITLLVKIENPSIYIYIYIYSEFCYHVRGRRRLPPYYDYDEF